MLSTFAGFAKALGGTLELEIKPDGAPRRKRFLQTRVVGHDCPTAEERSSGPDGGRRRGATARSRALSIVQRHQQPDGRSLKRSPPLCPVPRLASALELQSRAAKQLFVLP
jgi:hypothetical protein